jgi:hypothetical protein
VDCRLVRSTRSTSAGSPADPPTRGNQERRCGGRAPARSSSLRGPRFAVRRSAVSVSSSNGRTAVSAAVAGDRRRHMLEAAKPVYADPSSSAQRWGARSCDEAEATGRGPETSRFTKTQQPRRAPPRCARRPLSAESGRKLRPLEAARSECKPTRRALQHIVAVSVPLRTPELRAVVDRGSTFQPMSLAA